MTFTDSLTCGFRCKPLLFLRIFSFLLVYYHPHPRLPLTGLRPVYPQPTYSTCQKKRPGGWQPVVVYRMTPVGGRAEAQVDIDAAQAEAPRFEKVYWTREPHLRKLYAYAIVLMVASATTGYDGMLVNVSQQISLWRHFFGDDVTVDDNKLGVLINVFNIGSIVSFFITPYVADHFGRKIAIVVGCCFMVLGGCLTAFCNGYASGCHNNSSVSPASC